MSPADQHHLQAAQGWLELGDWQSANEELEKISAEMGMHPDLVELRWRIYAQAKNWSACADIGKALTQLAPGSAVSWIHHAYALHELKRTQDAFDVLSPVAQRFSDGAHDSLQSRLLYGSAWEVGGGA